MAENRSESTMAAEWSSCILRDLVRSVGDLLSATNDADMRAVCSNLSASIAKPPPLGLGGDHRFLEREWVMLDEKNPADGVGGRLFLNVSTGRFLRLPVPLLDERDYILVGASDGLLVLGEPKGLHDARLLDPFTGDLIPFVAPIPQESDVLTAVAGSSSSPTLLFWFIDCLNNEVVYCAEPTSPLCEVQFEGCGESDFGLRSLISYTGHFYVVDYDGGIFKVVGTAPHYRGELIAKTFDNDPLYYLVESARELLLVSCHHWEDLVEVFKVDTERKLLEPVTNIGSRALFLGCKKCLSVNADKLPSVDSNCIYYAPYFDTDKFTKYDLSNSKVEKFSCIFEDNEAIRPLSLVQTLLSYCTTDLPDTCAQIESLKN